MKQFSIDWEFSGKVQGVETYSDLDVKPISIGVVCDDGREYYAIFDRDHSQYNDPWLDEHVIAKLDPEAPRKTAEAIRSELWDFLLQDNPDRVIIWSDQAGYDQILFHSILSPANMFCVRDFQGEDKSRRIDFSLVRDYFELLGKPSDKSYLIKPDPALAHIAIDDARAQMQGLQLMDEYVQQATNGAASNYYELKKMIGQQISEQALGTGLPQPEL